MSIFKSALLAAAATLAVASVANAADPILPAPVIPVAPAPAGFDWNGFYAGVSAGAINAVDVDDSTDWTLGGQAGFNAQFDLFVIGAEVAVDAVFGDDLYAYGAALVRGGVAFDALLAYGAIGYGSDFGSDSVDAVGDHVLAGGGLEFAATQDLSFRGQYLYGWGQDAADEDIHKFSIGANFHF